eukprot:1392478-Amorphochlora_amoeboformis.AAC.1
MRGTHILTVAKGSLMSSSGIWISDLYGAMRVRVGVGVGVGVELGFRVDESDSAVESKSLSIFLDPDGNTGACGDTD